MVGPYEAGQRRRDVFLAGDIKKEKLVREFTDQEPITSSLARANDKKPHTKRQTITNTTPNNYKKRQKMTNNDKKRQRPNDEKRQKPTTKLQKTTKNGNQTTTNDKIRQILSYGWAL